jgi:hypothetical protein
MKISLVYTAVCGKSDPTAPEPDWYAPYTKRFVDSYLKYPAGIEHELIICFCGGDPSIGMMELFDPIATSYASYRGPGWDIGAYQTVSERLDADLAMFMAAPVNFIRADWLAPFKEAREVYGNGLYGPQASYENYPHIRTGCFACPPLLFNTYPHKIDSREKCCWFESGGGNPSWNFTGWMLANGYEARMVLPGRCCKLQAWRDPPNIFRRGDQSNLLIWDRHNDIYRESSLERQRILEKQANGENGHV